ncbi:16S rRNA (cytosine(1402)-N(4))-methyltransferase RsmH [[Mycoplasma] cavipharyngis]|uniref:16S rRNA (cytosine(1402)-N(4))-methyltransferase RsmH n=1 Tax=[Mycoplasma] cavipharyngis TaxID=92757 RepID=UPI0037039CBE
MNSLTHIPILKDDVVSFWKNQGSGIFVDCTFGRGGHSRALLEVIDQKSRLIALDIDQEAVAVGERLEALDDRFQMIYGNFKNLQSILFKLKIFQVDGILFDFGVSSPQLDNFKRGFSYQKNGPLDMRMDLNQKTTVADLLNQLSVGELAHIFEKYGECQESLKVARKILKHQAIAPITTTDQLVTIIKNSVAKKTLYQKKHPCKTYFQALRIYLNQELENIKLVLDQLGKIINSKGVIIFLTFHSLEEKLIKKWIRANTGVINLANLPISLERPFELITKKSIIPTDQEIATNPRARSTKMWVVKKR